MTEKETQKKVTEKNNADVKLYKPIKEVQTSHEDKSETSNKKEVGGRSGPEPTRYGDWENKGRCVDF